MTINCQICQEPAARFDGKLIIYSHSANHCVELPITEILEAIAKSEKGLILLRDFYDSNPLVNFIVK